MVIFPVGQKCVRAGSAWSDNGGCRGHSWCSWWGGAAQGALSERIAINITVILRGLRAAQAGSIDINNGVLHRAQNLLPNLFPRGSQSSWPHQCTAIIDEGVQQHIWFIWTTQDAFPIAHELSVDPTPAGQGWYCKYGVSHLLPWWNK